MSFIPDYKCLLHGYRGVRARRKVLEKTQERKMKAWLPDNYKDGRQWSAGMGEMAGLVLTSG